MKGYKHLKFGNYKVHLIFACVNIIYAAETNK